MNWLGLRRDVPESARPDGNCLRNGLLDARAASARHALVHARSPTAAATD